MSEASPELKPEVKADPKADTKPEIKADAKASVKVKADPASDVVVIKKSLVNMTAHDGNTLYIGKKGQLSKKEYDRMVPDHYKAEQLDAALLPKVVEKE